MRLSSEGGCQSTGADEGTGTYKMKCQNNFCGFSCRIKPVQVQRGRLEASILWYGGPLEAASKRKAFSCGMGLDRAGSSKAALVPWLQVQGRDILPWCCHQQILLLCSSLAPGAVAGLT